MGFSSFLVLLASQWRLFASKLHLVKLSEQTIDIDNPNVFKRILQVTSDFAEDMYCNTYDNAGCGNNFFKFINNPRYSGKLIKTFSARLVDHLPKLLIWDWDGDADLGIPSTRIVAIRGTHSQEEWEGNFDCTEMTGSELGMGINGWFHKDFANTSLIVWKNIESYIKDAQKPIIITGHSRGAALAELIFVLAKKRVENQSMYCFAYAPPPSMKLDASEENLTNGIYGFIHGNDPIPRFTIEQVYKAICYRKGIHTLAALVVYLKQVYNNCPDLFGQTICNTIDGLGYIVSGIFDFLLNGVTSSSKTYAFNALKTKAGLLIDLLNDYINHPEHFHIRGHCGKLYLLNWKKTDKLSNDVHTMEGCTEYSTPEEIEINGRMMIQFPAASGMSNNSLDDHHSVLYRRAIQDNICDFSQIQALSLGLNNNKSLPKINPKESIEYPSWIPSMDDYDDYISCDFSCMDQEGFDPETSQCETGFEWNSLNQEWDCSGVMINCNDTKITSLTCTNRTHVCQFDQNSGLNECYDIALINHKTRKARQDEPVAENRCMSTDKDECFYASSGYNKSSSGSSSNYKDGSSSGISNNRDSSSGSSHNQNAMSSASSFRVDSSWGVSNMEVCSDVLSCAKDLGDYTILSMFVGATRLVNFQTAYSLMRANRKLLGHLAPPPTFQHTAVWVGGSNPTDDSLGAIVVYGEYYPVNYDATYLSCDGARSFVMSLGDFRKTYNAYELKQMKPGRNMTLFPFLEEVKSSGRWGADDYMWRTHNCQHFTANCVKLLEARRVNQSKTDWMDLPSPIMKTIIQNEFNN